MPPLAQRVDVRQVQMFRGAGTITTDDSPSFEEPKRRSGMTPILIPGMLRMCNDAQLIRAPFVFLWVPERRITL